MLAHLPLLLEPAYSIALASRLNPIFYQQIPSNRTFQTLIIPAQFIGWSAGPDAARHWESETESPWLLPMGNLSECWLRWVPL